MFIVAFVDAQKQETNLRTLKTIKEVRFLIASLKWNKHTNRRATKISVGCTTTGEAIYFWDKYDSYNNYDKIPKELAEHG